MNIIKLITYRFNFLLKLKFLLKKTLSEGILIWIFISLFVMINLNFEEGLFPLLLFLIYFHSFFMTTPAYSIYLRQRRSLRWFNCVVN